MLISTSLIEHVPGLAYDQLQKAVNAGIRRQGPFPLTPQQCEMEIRAKVLEFLQHPDHLHSRLDDWKLRLVQLHWYSVWPIVNLEDFNGSAARYLELPDGPFWLYSDELVSHMLRSAESGLPVDLVNVTSVNVGLNPFLWEFSDEGAHFLTLRIQQAEPFQSIHLANVLPVFACSRSPTYEEIKGSVIRSAVERTLPAGLDLQGW
jgi:hypothetical protein